VTMRVGGCSFLRCTPQVSPAWSPLVGRRVRAGVPSLVGGLPELRARRLPILPWIRAAAAMTACASGTAARRVHDEAASSAAPPSKRVRATDVPCIVTMQEMLRGKEGVMSLAQGIVHWLPPPAVAEAVAKAAFEPDTSSYGADDGLPALREALTDKLRVENGLDNVRVMVTAGANQAYTNLVVAVLDAEDASVLFAPYYFNHLMAIQMTGGSDRVVLGPVNKDFLPDIDWLETRLATTKSGDAHIKMVTVVNPCNPTGVAMPAEHLQRLSAVCSKHGVWLAVDNTYENFSYEDEGHPAHTCVSGDHVVNVFSFSKAYGMMGWRVGYLAYPERLHGELMKVQDTIAICPSVIGQKAALAALGAGRSWVRVQVKGLAENRRIVRSAIEEALGSGSVVGGSGAIYFMIRLPVQDDLRVVEWLTAKHRVCVIPGSACGAPGMVRVGYANLETARCREASQRLSDGLKELAARGAAVLEPAPGT